MNQYIRYCVEVVDDGHRIKINARDANGETVNEPGGLCSLNPIPERIQQLAEKVRQGRARRAELDELGEALFAALFPAAVTTNFRHWLNQTGQQTTLLRLELDLNEEALPQVAALPWEFLRAPQTAGWSVDNLGTHSKVVLSRRRALWEAAKPIRLTSPLKIQLVVSAPTDLEKVVWEEVETALKDLAAKHPQLIAPPLPTLHQPNEISLDKALEKKPDILHFIGHGQLEKVRKIEYGKLALVGDDGCAHWVTDERIGALFQTHAPRVVFLQACESGTEGSAGAFIGVGSQIVQRNVPVVVAMQYPVSNEVAITFAEEFYQHLGELNPVDAAVQIGRRRLSQKFSDTRDFAAPVLFMRVKDGQLFEPSIASEEDEESQSAPPEGEETTVWLPAEWISELPYPLAAPAQKVNEATNDTERFAALNQLLVNFVKYLTSLALSHYWQGHPDKALLKSWLASLAEARLSASLNILESVADAFAAQSPEDPLLLPLLFAPYAQVVENDNPLAQAYQALKKLQPGKAEASDQTPRTFLHLLVQVRKSWEGATSGAPKSVVQALMPTLPNVLQWLLEQFRPLLAYPLGFVEQVYQQEGQTVYVVLQLAGPSGRLKELEPVRLSLDSPQPYKKESGYLFLCGPDGRPMLNLSPLVIRHGDGVYLLEDSTPGRVLYRDCASERPYEPPINQLSGGGKTSLTTAADDPVGALTHLRRNVGQVELTLEILLKRLSPVARQSLAIGLGESLRIGCFWLGVEFMIMGLSKLEGGLLANLLEDNGMESGDLRGVLRGLVKVRDEDWRKQRDVEGLGMAALPELQEINPVTFAQDFVGDKKPRAVITPRALNVLREAAQLAKDQNIGPEHLLIAVLQHPRSVAVNMLLGFVAQNNLDPRQFIIQVRQRAGLKPPDLDDGEAANPNIVADPDLAQPPPPPTAPFRMKGKGMLSQVGRDLTQLALEGQLREAVGETARKALAQMGLVLLQTQSNNPILLGDPGVGKTAIVEGFAWRLAGGGKGASPQLAGRRVIDLSPASLTAGTKYRGELEERLKQLLDEVRAAKGQIIVFIDEIHTILGGKAEGGLGSIAETLKPALARGEFPCIGATTVAEYRHHIESDPALARRFTPIWIDEPSIEDAVTIAQEVADKHLGPSHQVTYSEVVIKEAVYLAVRYLHDEFLPGKAIKLLDQAGPRVMLGGASISGRKESPAPGSEVTLEIVREIVAERTGIPLTRLKQDERTRLLQLEETLRVRVKGQEEAIARVAQVVKRALTGLSDPSRPPGVFLFAGPTGVGKTELALTLAEALFDEEGAIFRLDMSEFLEKHQVSRLIGSPPGYVGYHEEGQLTGRLRRRPYSVVLLDEMEKAHPDVQHLFLQLFDAGRITDSRGNLADGRNAIFIMTTNLGAKEALGFLKESKPYQDKMRDAIEEHFSPEFLGRVDRIIYFNPLTEGLVADIFDKMLARATQRFAAQRIVVEVTSSYKQMLCNECLKDLTRGARPLERLIEDAIVAPLTDQVLAGDLHGDMKVILDDKDIPLSVKPHVHVEPLAVAVPVGDERERATQRNQQAFAAEWELLAAQMQTDGLTVEVSDEARAFLCDPFWNENRPLPQALQELVAQPLRNALADQKFSLGDRVRVEKYAGALIFKKSEEAIL